MQNTAIVTGASGGIGEELAKIHAAKGGDLILIARNEEKLNQLKEKLEARYKIQCIVWPFDLCHPESWQKIKERLITDKIEVDILINNAGFGGYGNFSERQWKQDERMIDLNIKALSAITHTVLQKMVERKKGKILNVASTAGFMPGPLQATYFATKAFVQSFSQAIAEENRQYNVSCTALCPGPVKTGFEEAAEMKGSPLFKRAVGAEKVAKIAYKAMEKGKLIAINDKVLAFAVNWIIPLSPRRMVLKIVRKMQQF
jgi:short-subunit dehydrogenase